MMKLFGAIYILAAPTLAGILVVVLLSMNMYDSAKIAMAAIAGAIVAVPVSWFVSRHILALTRQA